MCVCIVFGGKNFEKNTGKNKHTNKLEKHNALFFKVVIAQDNALQMSAKLQNFPVSIFNPDRVVERARKQRMTCKFIHVLGPAFTKNFVENILHHAPKYIDWHNVGIFKTKNSR